MRQRASIIICPVENFEEELNNQWHPEEESTLNAVKSICFQTSIKYLDFEIATGVRLGNVKTFAVQQFPIPLKNHFETIEGGDENER